MKDIKKLAFNLIHNVGNIYDNVDALTRLLMAKDYTSKVFWVKTGYLTGDIIN
jgi:hypothetical protein